MKNLSKKQRNRLLFCSIISFFIAIAVALFPTVKPSFFGNVSAVNDYSLTFNRNNGGAGFPSSYGSGVNNNGHTKNGNTIAFTYNNAKSTSNKFCTLASGGYLYNSTVITGLETVNVIFSGGSLSLYSSKTTTFSGDANSLTSGSALAISANYDYFKLLASGETVIETITVSYTCSTRPESSDVTDVITATDLEATGTQYVDFSGVTKTSDAVYAGSSAKNGTNIQLKSNNSNTGLISTTSGGTVKSVKITVASGSNTINVYGSSTAYTSVGELFNNSTQGTKVGNVSSTGTINFTGDNANLTYVGIRSNSGAVYISSIEITWVQSGGSGGGDTPTPEPGVVDLTATFPYHNTEPSSINVLRDDDSVFSTLSTSISSVKNYLDPYSEYEIDKNEYILITNSNPNVTIKSIDVKMYQYRNFDVYVDGSSSYTYHGDGGRDTSSDPLVVNVTVNASTSVKIVSNGGTGTYSWKVYGVDLYLSGIEGETSVSGVSLNKTSTSIAPGETEQLTATIAPSYATNKNVNWSTSNGSVATVSSSGLVTGVAVGTATITVTTVDGGKTATCTVTVATVAVTSVTLNKSSLSLALSATETLTATVTPANATNKNINWSSSDTSVATVSNGTVTGVSAGTATITATSAADNTKYATCTVTVSASTDCTIDLTAQGFTDQQTVTTVIKNSYTLTFAQATGANPPKYYNSGTSVRTYANNTLTVATSGSDKITKIVFTLGSKAEATPTSDVGTYNGNTRTWTGSATSIVFTNASSGQYHYQTVTITVTPSTPVNATGVSLPATQEINIGGNATLPVTYTPSNANTGLAVTWSKVSGSNKISVNSSGKVSVDSTATTSDTATIRVTLTSNNAHADCTISVIEIAKAKYTVLLYLCGSTLEYDSDYNSLDGAATDDMGEILSASGTYKSDVNFVVETGGSKKWKSTYGVSKDKLEVRHVSGNSYVKDNPSEIDSQANMGDASTLQTFLEYGLTAYPADKTALILWNHGGAMTGVCCDDNYSMQCLTAAEVKSAVSGALSNCGMSGQKLEWIGYDACLMGVADIASINSDYFNYMVASEESEPGDGWDYETWVSTLYNNPTNTKTVLNSITTSFQTFYNGYSNTRDATLAAYDLSYMPAFTTAFENFASHLTTSDWSKLTTAYNNSLKFGADSSSNYMYGIADMNSFMLNVATQNSSLSTYTSAVIDALDDLVLYNKYCSDYNSKTHKPCGICVFMAYTSNTQYYPYTVKAEYTTNDTKFTTWRTYNINNGEWAS